MRTEYTDDLSFLQRFSTATLAFPVAYLVKLTQIRLALGYGNYTSISTLGVGVNYILCLLTLVFEFPCSRLPFIHYEGPLFSTWID